MNEQMLAQKMRESLAEMGKDMAQCTFEYVDGVMVVRALTSNLEQFAFAVAL